MKTIPTTSASRFLLLPALVLTLGLGAVNSKAASDRDEILFEDDFNNNTNFNGWFVFGGGANFNHRGDIVPFAGKDGTNALVFSANAESFRNWWFGGIGRVGIIEEPWTTLDKLTLQLEIGSLGDEKTHRVALRLVQGDPNKPTWSATWMLEVNREIKTYTLVLSTGEQTGEYNRETPITLHAITFGHNEFGAAPDIQILVDNVKTFGRNRMRPLR